MKLPEMTSPDGSVEAVSAVAPVKTTITLPTITTDAMVAVPGGFDSALTTAVAMPATKRSLRWLWIVLAIFFGLILAAYIGFAVFFMSHFSFNTVLNGSNVAFQTADEVDSLLALEMDSYSLELKGREDQRATLKGTDIDLHYVADGQVASILARQQPWAWPLTLLPDNTTTIEHVNVAFDEQRLDAVLAALSLMDEAQMRTPVDASLVFEGNAYAISPGDEGTTLDKEKTTAAVRAAITAGQTALDLDESALYVRPAVVADDPTLTANRDRFNQYVPFQIVYTLGDRREVLDGNTTINWVNTEGAGPYVLNDEAVWAWLAGFAARYDTLGATRTIVNGFGEEKTVSGGTYGWQIDQDAEYWAILAAFEQHLGEEREPYLSGWAASLDAQDWGKTYLEVDLSAQHMWYVVDGVSVLDTDIVSGNPNTGYATPEGVWAVFQKAYKIVARGDRLPDGSYEWEVPVTWWMQFTYDGCGFHDAGWQPYFGGTRYLTNGSHGCINMPPHLAEELYSMLEVDTPVITHY
jgi:hypothetical protein